MIHVVVVVAVGVLLLFHEFLAAVLAELLNLHFWLHLLGLGFWKLEAQICSGLTFWAGTCLSLGRKDWDCGKSASALIVWQFYAFFACLPHGKATLAAERSFTQMSGRSMYIDHGQENVRRAWVSAFNLATLLRWFPARLWYGVCSFLFFFYFAACCPKVSFPTQLSAKRITPSNTNSLAGCASTPAAPWFCKTQRTPIVFHGGRFWPLKSILLARYVWSLLEVRGTFLMLAVHRKESLSLCLLDVLEVKWFHTQSIFKLPRNSC